MCPSISLSGLSWSTPDGRTLFSDLELRFGQVRTGLVGRNGTGKTTLLKLISGEYVPVRGTIHVDARLSILRQRVQPASDETIATLFGADAALDLLRRAGTGRAAPGELSEADWTLEARIAECLAGLGLEASPETPLAALSGGQRTRAMLAALTFTEPDFLLLDEPTNNLDAEGREAVKHLLARWKRGAIIVSHDRALLEEMDEIVELTSLGAARYGGNWSHYRRQKALELQAAEHDLANAQRKLKEIARISQETREKQAQRDKRGRAKKAKGDLPRIILGARKNNAEATSGKNVRLAEHRQIQAKEDASAARARIEVLQPFTITLAPAGLHAGRLVLEAKSLHGGHDKEAPIIRNLSMTIEGPERIAITGANGSGKTTLLKLLTGELEPFSGSVRLHVPHAMLDQQVSLIDRELTVADNFLRLNPDMDERSCRAALARFRFRAEAALQSAGTLSGGEMLRAGLACVLGGLRPPPLLLLDEPTNHLDMESTEILEEGIAAYDGALIAISHDETFLDAIRIGRRIDIGTV
ncbi:MAG: ABC-F family ATP-binding cassette domain-containing protein [Pseudomonadota bacterium]|jgi:ATPase subunit of ABC transporter with duplicated ATPase domains